jgi:hypothetical protein
MEPDERAELEQLRAEVARLRAAVDTERAELAEMAAGAPSGPRGTGVWRGRGRATAAAVLIILGVLLAPLSVVSVWARGVVTDTDRYVETVAPLADDPALQQAVADKLTDKVFEYVDVQALTTQAFAALAERGSLPPALANQLTALAVPLANGARNFAEGQVLRAVQSDAFDRAWVEAQRVAHQQVVAMLRGETSVLRVQGDAVAVDLGEFLTVVKQRLVESGFTLAERIPAVDAQFVVFQSDQVSKVQRGFRVLDTLGFWLPFVCVVLVGAGIFLARDRRLAFFWTGVGFAVGMLIVGASLALARETYLESVPTDVLPPDAAAAVYDTLVRFLRDAIRAGFLIGVLVAAAAFLAGPSVAAVTLRGWGRAGLAYTKGGVGSLGLDLAPVTRWVQPRAGVLRGAVLAIGFVVLLVQRYRTPDYVAWVAFGVVVGLVVVEFLAVEPRAPRRPDVTEPAPVEIPSGAPA